MLAKSELQFASCADNSRLRRLSELGLVSACNAHSHVSAASESRLRCSHVEDVLARLEQPLLVQLKRSGTRCLCSSCNQFTKALKMLHGQCHTLRWAMKAKQRVCSSGHIPSTAGRKAQQQLHIVFSVLAVDQRQPGPFLPKLRAAQTTAACLPAGTQPLMTLHQIRLSSTCKGHCNA